MAQDRQDATDKGAGEAISPGLLGTRVAFRARLLHMLLANRVIAAFAPFGLRTGAFTTMALIAANPGCSQADLAREGGLDKSGLVATVDELEARGLARRGRVAGDRRRNSLSLTEEGEKVMREMYEVALAAEAPIRGAMSPAQLETLFELLEIAYGAMREADGERG